MADTGLMSLDPLFQQLAQLQATYGQPSPADQDAARTQQLQTFFLNMFGAPKGGEFQRMGQSGLMALQVGNQQRQLADQRRQQMLQNAGGMLSLQNAMQAYQDQQGMRSALKDFYSGQGLPGAGAPGTPAQPSMPAPQSIAPDAVGGSGMGGGTAAMFGPSSATGLLAAPTPPAPAAASPSPAQPPGGIPPKTALYKQYEAMSQLLAQRGLPVQAQQYAEMAQKYRPKLFKTEEGTDPQSGQRVQINYFDDGTHEILRDVGAPQKELKQVDTGSSIGFADPYTGRLAPGASTFAKTMTPGEQVSNYYKATEIDPMGMLGIKPGGPPPTPGMAPGTPSASAPPPAATGGIAGGLHGDEFLQTLAPNIAAQVKALAEGRQSFPTGYALRSPVMQGLIQAVSQYDPTFDAVNYQSRAATRKDFTAGKSAENIKALNTAMSHLGSLSDSFNTLNNFGGALTPLNAPVNYLEKTFGDPRQKDVQVKTEAVSNELAKVFRSSGMSQSEIGRWADAISPNMSPDQQKAVINGALDLMQGRMQALADTYNRGLGTTGDGLTLLSPQAQQVYAKLRGTVPSATGAPAPATAPGPAPAGVDKQTGRPLFRRADGKLYFTP